VTLEQIKGDKTFAGWDLIRIGAIERGAVPDAMLDRVIELAAGE